LSSWPNCSGLLATSSQNLAYQPGNDQLPITVAGMSGRVVILGNVRRISGREKSLAAVVIATGNVIAAQHLTTVNHCRCNHGSPVRPLAAIVVAAALPLRSDPACPAGADADHAPSDAPGTPGGCTPCRLASARLVRHLRQGLCQPGRTPATPSPA